MKRLSLAQLLRLGDDLPPSEREVLETVGRLHLASHAQLAALLALGLSSDGAPASRARQTRRVLQRLAEAGLLARLERRVGCVRAGSSGFVYYLGPAGQRLLAYWQGRGLIRGRTRPEPGTSYVAHRLAVSQLYVDLCLAEKVGELELLQFDAEPDCWRIYQNGFGESVRIKPDAFVRLGVGAYEERAFVEVDLGSESRTVIARKLRAYSDYYRSGQEQATQGVFPRVVILVSTEARKAALVDVAARLPTEDWHLFTIGLLSGGARLLRGDPTDQAERESEALV